MFESNNITITGKSAVLSILYTVVTRQKNKQKKKHKKKNPHVRTHTSSSPYRNVTRIKPEAQKAKQQTRRHYLKTVDSKALWDL